MTSMSQINRPVIHVYISQPISVQYALWGTGPLVSMYQWLGGAHSGNMYTILDD